jgi:5-methylcytosine-specific restriction endonuclease McrA
MKRHTAKLQRTPVWLSDDDRWMLEQAYELAVLREEATGVAYQVDHIVPLQGLAVSGLHVPWNLQVIPAIENKRKGNRV